MASGDFAVSITSSGALGDSSDTIETSLGPGESATIPLAWGVDFAGGELTMTITLDPDDLIDESDETNNALTRTLTIESCKQPVIDYFALGDSVASGHGLGDDGRDALGNGTESGEDLTACRRSAVRSYPGQLVRDLEQDYEEVNFYHLACTGARASYDADKAIKECSKRVDDDSECRYQLLGTQVDEAIETLEANRTAETERPTLITITIGANDFEFVDPLTIYRTITGPDPHFDAYVALRSSHVRLGLQVALLRLLEYPNVSIVVTGVHNPFNQNSFMFTFAGSRCSVRHVVGIDCYQRTEEAAHAINQAITDTVESLGTNHRERVALADDIHDLFHGRESPRDSAAIPFVGTSCGSANPSPLDTWIQYPADPNSNSYALKYDWKSRAFVPDGAFWKGDCFHPNDEGAYQYRLQVYEAMDTLELWEAP